MYRTDADGSVASVPAPAALGTEGYFSWGNPGTGQAATELDQDWFNMVQEGLVAFLTASGVAHSKSDYSRLWQAVLRCATFQDASAAANHLVAGPPAGVSFAAGSLGLGTTVKVKVANANTGAVDFNWAGGGAAPVQYPDGSAIGEGEFALGQVVELVYDGAGHWAALAPAPVAIKRFAPAIIWGLSAAGTGNFTVPAGIWRLYGECVGAGGGGAGHNSSTGYTGGGGAAGGFASGSFAVSPGQIVAYAVGAGGAAGAAGTSGTDGGAGGTTSFGSYLTAPGGGPGISTASAAGGYSTIGSAPGGGFVDVGGMGSDGDSSGTAHFAGQGGASHYGGGTRGSASGVVGSCAVGGGGGGGYNSHGGDTGRDGGILIWG